MQELSDQSWGRGFSSKLNKDAGGKAFLIAQAIRGRNKRDPSSCFSDLSIAAVVVILFGSHVTTFSDLIIAVDANFISCEGFAQPILHFPCAYRSSLSTLMRSRSTDARRGSSISPDSSMGMGTACGHA
ncbi:hypothetical protein RRG08_026313 [Elysia crispata]|uniref:Uncharacterized protein n=1 Tax=Elysia crispata TaxID=231223 RepID=A0AAE0ZBH0_9GAST|nr:hypothetical protein RRG08_026313 [Elysia crispata]